MSVTGELTWTMINAHGVRPEPPDTMFLRVQGDLDVASAREMVAMMRRFCEGTSSLLLLVDMAGLRSLPADARKVLAELLLEIPVAATAAFGASFAQRVVATMADKTNNLIRGSRAYETRFFANEAQARAWLEQKRRRGKPGQPKG
jgi:hypothetical protein